MVGKCVRCVTWHVTLTSRAHEPQGILGLEWSKGIHVLGVVEKCFVIIRRYLDGFVRVTLATLPGPDQRSFFIDEEPLGVVKDKVAGTFG